MQNATEMPIPRAGDLPCPPPNQSSQVPTLPRVAAVVPPPAGAPRPNAFATSMNPTPAGGQPRRQSNGGVRRFLSWLLVLAVVGGLAVAGFVYGPELLERATDEGIDEPAAALVFPTPVAAPPPIRTASYTVEQMDAAGDVHSYSVTTDYESGVAKVTVDRGDLPGIEVLSVFDQSLIRRVDEPTWYRMARGDFPVDSSLGRARYVRTLDEMLPPAIRPTITIERSTESVIANEPARRLLLSVDPNLLTPLSGTIAPTPTDDLTDPGPPATLAPGMRLRPGVDLLTPLEIEIWIDVTGVVRKAILPPELGGETITVTSLSGEPFETPFPADDAITPLTADALFHLGL